MDFLLILYKINKDQTLCITFLKTTHLCALCSCTRYSTKFFPNLNPVHNAKLTHLVYVTQHKTTAD